MPRAIADLHIHSRFSLATSPALNLHHLAHWAMRKGITLLGTGDFTHPAWRAELRASLCHDDATGFYRLAEAPAGPHDGVAARVRPPSFCLQAEISCVCKVLGQTRKVHNLVFMPHLEAAERFCAQLARHGKLAGDGRPTVGLSPRDLLELALGCADGAVLVPAHVWTPWFGLFGSKSGFDNLRDCYGDLSDHIFALETGLSSDPPMNRLVGALDGYALISNSDAHSGPNLGREANLFSGELTYDSLFGCLRAQAKRQPPRSGPRFMGTLEFYPQEGKYHLDGHRACAISLNPAESRRLGNICPICQKPLTIGVLNRVMALADRSGPPELPNEPPTRMQIPLAEMVGQILNCSPQSKKVRAKCAAITSTLGPELDILCLMDIPAIRAYWEPLGEAVERTRKGAISIEAGYDGEYGKLRIFDPEELA